MALDISEIKDLVTGSMNATVQQNGYIIYGMSISDQAIDSAIEMARRNLLAIVGLSEYNNPSNEIKLESYIVDMACMRCCLTMLGVSIPTHFNYKTTNLSVSKNPNPSLEEMLRRYEQSIAQWTRMIMGNCWTGVVLQDDLQIDRMIEYNGKQIIGHDADAMLTYYRR